MAPIPPDARSTPAQSGRSSICRQVPGLALVLKKLSCDRIILHVVRWSRTGGWDFCTPGRWRSALHGVFLHGCGSEEFFCDFAGGDHIGSPAGGHSWRWHQVRWTPGGPHRTPRGRIQQASFQSHDDALGMEGGYISFPAPYLDVEGAACELALRGQSSRFLWASRRLPAYGRNDSLRGNDRDTSLCELLPHLRRQDIRDGDTPRAIRIGMQK
jgi:hypothetical protein